MKKFSLCAAMLLAVGICLGTGAVRAEEAPAAPHQIGLIDMAHIFKNYEKFKDQTASLEAAAKNAQSEVQKMVEQGKQLQAQLQGLQPDTPDYSRIETEIIALQNKIKTYQQVEQRDIVRKQAELYKSIYLEVQNVVSKYANHYHYTLVIRFDRNEVAETSNPQEIIQSMTRQVVYYQPQDDITQPILDYLNNQYKKTAGR